MHAAGKYHRRHQPGGPNDSHGFLRSRRSGYGVHGSVGYAALKSISASLATGNPRTHDHGRSMQIEQRTGVVAVAGYILD